MNIIIMPERKKINIYFFILLFLLFFFLLRRDEKPQKHPKDIRYPCVVGKRTVFCFCCFFLGFGDFHNLAWCCFRIFWTGDGGANNNGGKVAPVSDDNCPTWCCCATIEGLVNYYWANIKFHI